MLGAATSGMDDWHMLGFTDDDVITAWQDSRMSGQFVGIWRDAGRPPGFQVLAQAGTSHHLVLWYVSAEAARLLDAAGCDWRRFLLASHVTPPAQAHPVLIDAP